MSEFSCIITFIDRTQPSPLHDSKIEMPGDLAYRFLNGLYTYTVHSFDQYLQCINDVPQTLIHANTTKT